MDAFDDQALTVEQVGAGGGSARVVWTGKRGDSLAVIGWLDRRTVLLQVGEVAGASTSLLALRLGDPAATLLTTGMFAALG